MAPEHLHKLARPCTAEEIEWRVGSVTKEKDKGMALAYLTNRAVQDRLDDVVGPGYWRNEYKAGPEGGVICGLSIRIEYPDGYEWVTKWDGADNTKVEATKGGLSDAMKRAAVQWGIGRDLYSLPAQWVPLDEDGRFAQQPRYTPAKTRAVPAVEAPSVDTRAIDKVMATRLEQMTSTDKETLNAWWREVQEWPVEQRNKIRNAIKAEAERRKAQDAEAPAPTLQLDGDERPDFG